MGNKTHLAALQYVGGNCLMLISFHTDSTEWCSLPFDAIDSAGQVYTKAVAVRIVFGWIWIWFMFVPCSLVEQSLSRSLLKDAGY